jgi:hypothetical protein
MLSNSNTDNGSSQPLASEEPALASAARSGSAADQPNARAEMEEKLKKMLSEYEERFDDVDEKLK